VRVIQRCVYAKQVAVLTAMYEDGADFTNTFRALAAVDAAADAAGSIPAALQEARPAYPVTRAWAILQRDLARWLSCGGSAVAAPTADQTRSCQPLVLVRLLRAARMLAACQQ